jgi:hypothetical protein
MPSKIQLRRGTAANWTSANPVLSAGEPGFETDTGKSKIGDGTTAWNSLVYHSSGHNHDAEYAAIDHTHAGGGDGSFTNLKFSVNKSPYFEFDASSSSNDKLSLERGTDWAWCKLSDTRFVAIGDGRVGAAPTNRVIYSWIENYDIDGNSTGAIPITANIALPSVLGDESVSVTEPDLFKQDEYGSWSIEMGGYFFNDAAQSFVTDGSETTLGLMVDKINQYVLNKNRFFMGLLDITQEAHYEPLINQLIDKASLISLSKAALNVGDEVIIEFVWDFYNGKAWHLIKGTDRFYKIDGANNIRDINDVVVGTLTNVTISTQPVVSNITARYFLTCPTPGTLSFENHPITSTPCLKYTPPAEFRSVEDPKNIDGSFFTNDIYSAPAEYANNYNRAQDDGNFNVYDITSRGIERVSGSHIGQGEIYYPQLIRVSDTKCALIGGDSKYRKPGDSFPNSWTTTFRYIDVAPNGTITFQDPIEVLNYDNSSNLGVFLTPTEIVVVGRERYYNPGTLQPENFTTIRHINIETNTILGELVTLDITEYNDKLCIQKLNNTKILVCNAYGDDVITPSLTMSVYSCSGGAIVLENTITLDNTPNATPKQSNENEFSIKWVNPTQVIVTTLMNTNSVFNTQLLRLVTVDANTNSLTLEDTYDITRLVGDSNNCYSYVSINDNNFMIFTLFNNKVKCASFNISGNKINLLKEKEVVEFDLRFGHKDIYKSISTVKLTDTKVVLIMSGYSWSVTASPYDLVNQQPGKLEFFELTI